MPQLVDIEGKGMAEFPDDASPTEIEQAIYETFPDIAAEHPKKAALFAERRKPVTALSREDEEGSIMEPMAPTVTVPKEWEQNPKRTELLKERAAIPSGDGGIVLADIGERIAYNLSKIPESVIKAPSLLVALPYEIDRALGLVPKDSQNPASIPAVSPEQVRSAAFGNSRYPGTAGEGAKQFASELASGFTSPEMAGALVATGGGAAAAKAGGMAFSADMIQKLPEQIQNYLHEREHGDLESQTKAALGVAASVGFPVAIAHGMAKTAPPVGPVNGQANFTAGIPSRLPRTEAAVRAVEGKTALPPEAKIAVADIPAADPSASSGTRPQKATGTLNTFERVMFREERIELAKTLRSRGYDPQILSDKVGRMGIGFIKEEDAASVKRFQDLTDALEEDAAAWAGQKPATEKVVGAEEFVEPKKEPTVEPPVAKQSLTTETPGEVRGEAKAKEPWEMTQREVLAAYPERGEIGVSVASLPEAVGSFRKISKAASFEPNKYNQAKESAARGHVERLHKAAVEQAIREGKLVPPEVLADYPDLKPQAKPVTPQQQIRLDAKEFDGLLVPFGYEKDATLDTAKHGTDSIEARVKQSADIKSARAKAFSELHADGLDPSSPADRAKMLPKLKAYFEKFVNFEQSAEERPVNMLSVGDKFTILDEPFKVIEVTADGEVMIKGRSTRRLKDGDNIKIDPDSYAKVEQSGEFVPPEKTIPKLSSSQKKGTGELFQKEDQPFNLAGEKATDLERVAREKEAAEKAKREAAELQAKQQADLPMDESKAKPAKWTSATAELGGELYAFIPNPIAVAKSVASLAKHATKALSPHVRRGADYVADLVDEIMHAGKMTEYRTAVLNWSAKLQRSFGEASDAQREIQSKVPNKARRDGITNWREAGGDAAVLKHRLAATKAWRDPLTGLPHPQQKRLVAGYEAALKLTPDEITVAGDAKAAYDTFGVRGQAHGVLNSFLDDYVTHIWNLNKGPATGSSRTLRDKFRFAKARSFDTFFDGEQAGYTPKTKDISELLPVYLHEMNSVIAARQLAKELHKATATDGEPMVQMRGSGTPVDGPNGQATLIMPKTSKPGAVRYRVLENQPALHDWIWASKDTDGKPIFLKADMALHPEAYDKLKSVLGRSAIREWYETRTSLTANIPRYIAKGIDMANSETKRTMLGFFAPFHQVQEGWHGIGHRVNPFFGIPKIDLVGDAGQMDAARHGLMLLPDRASANQFMEGFRVSGLVSKIPVLGQLADHYSHYLFHEYIPGLKFKTYEAILERNQKVYAKDIAAGKATMADVKHLSSEQANAAYGHLNYADLGSNPTIQHIAQLALLAPDFLEARGRFAAQAVKGVTGSKVGREQLIALATLAIAQATLAWTASKLTGGGWDEKNPFEFHVGTRKYTMRSVPEDTVRLGKDLVNVFGSGGEMPFIYNRLSPLIGKGLIQAISGVDWRGAKVTLGETAKELAVQPVPLTLRALTRTSKSSLAWWEQLASAAGIKISRYNPRQELNDLHQDWLKNNPDPKVREDFERNQKSTYPVSAYSDLDNALKDRNDAKALAAISKLRESGRKDTDILKRMRPGTATGFTKPLFHEKRKMESDFLATLDAKGRALYEKAKEDRIAQYRYFLELWVKAK